MNTPPGLTCASCERDLYPRLARRTDAGYVHAPRCPRLCTVPDCGRTHLAHGHCATHYRRIQRGGLQRPPLEIEDVEWMADTGESLTGAAARLHITPNALTQRLRGNSRGDLLARLRARDPLPVGGAA